MKSKIFYISKKWVLYCKPEARLQVQFHVPIGDPKLKGEIQGKKFVSPLVTQSLREKSRGKSLCKFLEVSIYTVINLVTLPWRHFIFEDNHKLYW